MKMYILVENYSLNNTGRVMMSIHIVNLCSLVFRLPRYKANIHSLSFLTQAGKKAFHLEG